MSKKAIIRLTNTMLNKSIIDANKTVCNLAEEFDFKYSDADAGDRFELVGKYKDNTIGGKRARLENSPMAS